MTAVQAHKAGGENLILITHSGCIDQFERKVGVPGGPANTPKPFSCRWMAATGEGTRLPER